MRRENTKSSSAGVAWLQHLSKGKHRVTWGNPALRLPYRCFPARAVSLAAREHLKVRQVQTSDGR
jgi:hypothetical protein